MPQFSLNTLVMRMAAVGLAAGLGMALPAHAQADKAKTEAPKEALSAPVGKALKDLQPLLDAKNYKDAMAKVDAADALPNKTPYEQFVIERNRGAIASQSGDMPTAIKSVTYVIESKRLPAEEQLSFMEGLIGMHYNSKDYASAIKWMERYFAEGGKNPQIKTLQAQSYYLAGDYAKAHTALLADITAAEAAGTAVPEIQYQLLLNSAGKNNDRAAVTAALEKMVTYYPTRDAWSDYLIRHRARPGYPDSSLLDYYRLKQALGIKLEGDEAMDLADLAMRAGLPAEAKKALDEADKAGLIGKGKDAKAEKAALAKATKAAADDLKTMAAGEATAQKAKDGLPLVNLGLAYVTAGQADKGIPMMEEGIKRGGLKRPSDAKLRLGYAYAQAGRKDDALRTFKSIDEKDVSGELARYWVMMLTKPVTE